MKDLRGFLKASLRFAGALSGSRTSLVVVKCLVVLVRCSTTPLVSRPEVV